MKTEPYVGYAMDKKNSSNKILFADLVPMVSQLQWVRLYKIRPVGLLVAFQPTPNGK